MSFVAKLRPELIVVDPEWRNFNEAAVGLVDVLVGASVVPRAIAQDVVTALQTREADSSTAILEIGVGVPHARLEALTTPAVALAVSPNGFYEAAPTVPIHILALVLSPLRATEDHLRTLAGIATLLRSTDLRAALRHARSPGDAMAAVQAASRPVP